MSCFKEEGRKYATGNLYKYDIMTNQIMSVRNNQFVKSISVEQGNKSWLIENFVRCSEEEFVTAYSEVSIFIISAAGQLAASPHSKN